MPDDNRLDINADLDKVGGDFLKDVQAAAEQVKKRKASDIATDRHNASKEKDRKLSAVIIAAAAVVLLVIAYFVVFARQPEGTLAPPSSSSQAANARINPARSVVPPPVAPPRAAPTRGNGQQADQQPYSDDQQPGQ